MYLGQNIKQILPGNVAIGGANMGMVPLFSVQWCPSRDAIWAGYVAADGQELDDNLFPDAAAGIAANNVPTTSNANWLADPMARGAYVAGSSAGKFRVPDYNGKSVGSLGAVFLRGDGEKSGVVNGLIQQDALQDHTHTQNSDAVNQTTAGGGVAVRASTTSQTSYANNARTAAETRPLNVTGCWVIKLFGAVTNMGSADAAQLASSYASLAANKVDIASFLGSNQSLVVGGGYQKLPGGLIIQWGATNSIALSANQVYSATYSFPIAFPTAALTVACSSTNQEIICSAAAVSSTQISLGFKNTLGVVASSNNRYIAIGY